MPTNNMPNLPTFATIQAHNIATKRKVDELRTNRNYDPTIARNLKKYEDRIHAHNRAKLQQYQTASNPHHVESSKKMKNRKRMRA